MDILASNPPYVAENQPEMVQRDVREFEPHGALFGGADGLNFYRRLLVEAFGVVRPGGFLVCEIGYSQLDPIAEMVAASRWQLVEIIHDLQGIARTLVIRKTPEGARRPLRGSLDPHIRIRSLQQVEPLRISGRSGPGHCRRDLF